MLGGGPARHFGASMPLPFASPDHPDLVALSLTPFSWRRNLGEWLRAGEPAASILDRLLKNPRLKHDGVDRPSLMSRAAAAASRAAGSGLHLVAWNDASYPAALSAIVDPPPALWVRGNPAVLTSRTVAIVGSRAGSPYALAVAERLAADLSTRGIVIVSGLARGVDSAAHRGTLSVSGPT